MEAKSLIEFAARLESQSNELATNSSRLDAVKVGGFSLLQCAAYTDPVSMDMNNQSNELATNSSRLGAAVCRRYPVPVVH